MIKKLLASFYKKLKNGWVIYPFFPHNPILMTDEKQIFSWEKREKMGEHLNEPLIYFSIVRLIKINSFPRHFTHFIKWALMVEIHLLKIKYILAQQYWL